jgi:hypothetical protein
VAVVLDELEGVAPEVRDALDAGTTQDNAHYWVAFNPVSPDDAAGQFWAATPEAARIHLSSIDCAEWQERTGHKIPGMPTLAAIEAKWKGRENEPRYYSDVLGEFPPESADWVIVPKDWYDLCTNCIPTPESRDYAHKGIGVDTGGGSAETGACGVIGRVILPVRASRTGHDTIAAALAVRQFESEMGRGVPIAVDWIGLGGKGVGEQLRHDGRCVFVFRGGARAINELVAPEVERELTRCPDLYADNITWGYFALREATRATVEAIKAGRPDRYISFPDDAQLRDQLSRRYKADQDRRYKLASKDSANSPDRADMAAMAWLAATATTERTVRVDLSRVVAPVADNDVELRRAY